MRDDRAIKGLHMRYKGLFAGLLAILAPISATAQPHVTDAQVIGRWINPYGSVMVDTQRCGLRLCGKISWASQEALQDARDAGVPALVGTELLQDYKPAANGVWHGRVFVPDMGRTFVSTLDVENADALRISGCILGGLICKSQVWHRHA